MFNRVLVMLFGIAYTFQQSAFGPAVFNGKGSFAGPCQIVQLANVPLVGNLQAASVWIRANWGW